MKLTVSGTITITALLALVACGFDGAESTDGEAQVSVDSSSSDHEERIAALESQVDDLEGQVSAIEESEGAGDTVDEDEEDSGPEEETDTSGSSNAGSGDNPVIGETWLWDDGLALTLSDMRSYEPSYEDVTSYDRHVVLDVTVENGTGDNYDPRDLRMTASSGGQEAETAYDTGQGLNGYPTTTVLDGQSVTFEFGFGVADLDDLTVEISDSNWDIDRESVIFVSE